MKFMCICDSVASCHLLHIYLLGAASGHMRNIILVLPAIINQLGANLMAK